MSKRRGWVFVLVILMLGLLSASTFAQVATTGKIAGVVIDPSGAAVPNATVSVRSTALMAERATTTGADGAYLVDLLPPGTYEVAVTSKGFKGFSESGIVLTAGFTATVNAKLQVGEVSDVVKVEGEPVVDLQNVQASTTFDQTLLQNIPSGRDPWSTVAQMPGATISTVDVGGNQSYQQSTMQVHGSTPGEQVFSFNGLDLNWPGANGGYTQFYTDHDSFDEFQVVADNAPASVSVSGIYMNMVTKSGSNQFHGQAAAYYATAGSEASPSGPAVNFASPIVMDRDTSVGAGGPILKERWWIFGSYRRYDLHESILSVRTQAGAPVQDINHQTNTALRSDWQLNPKNKLSFVWLYNEQNRFFRRDTAFAFVSQEASWLQIEPAYILQALWTSQITTNLLVDVRLGWNKEVFPLSYQPGVMATDFTRQDNILNTETGAAPFSFSNPSWVLKYSAGASWYKGNLKGTHNFKFGFDWGDHFNPYNYNINLGITALYSNGVPQSITAYDTPFHERTYFRDASFYVQDAWTLRRRLTLNLGLRYDRFTSYYPQQNTSTNLTFPQLFPPTTFPASGNIVDWNNVSPRLGFAYDVTGKGTSVVRFSYGRFYKMEGTQLVEQVNPVGFAGKTFVWTDTNRDGIPQTSEWINNQQIGAFGGTSTHINPNMTRPYSDEISATYEKQLWRDLRVSAAYYFRTKKNMIGLENTAVTAGDYTAVTKFDNGQPLQNALTGQPLTLFNQTGALGQFNFLMTNIPLLDDNRYDGLEVTAVKRMSNRWQLLAGFTVQRQKGQWYIGGSDDALFDNFSDPNLNINRANNYLNMDSTYVFKVDSSYDLPWKFSSSINFQHYTGFPIQPTEVFGGVSGPGTGVTLNQGPETIIAEPAGILRYPSVNLLNLRFSREFAVRDRFRIQPLIDLFNVTNRQTIVSESTVLGPSFRSPSNSVNPFLTRFGVRVNF